MAQNPAAAPNSATFLRYEPRIPAMTYTEAIAVFEDVSAEHAGMTDEQLAGRISGYTAMSSDTATYGLVRAALARHLANHAKGEQTRRAWAVLA